MSYVEDVALLLLEHGADPGIRDTMAKHHYMLPQRQGNLMFRWQLLEPVSMSTRVNNQCDADPCNTMGKRHVALLCESMVADPCVRDSIAKHHTAAYERETLKFARQSSGARCRMSTL